MNNKISNETLALFSEIFQFWIRRIGDGEEKTVAPGELCIKPLADEGGVLYWRDPITGQLITPNSLEDLQIILDHFNKEDGTMSADKVGGIRFYTNLNDIKLGDGVNQTPDTIISHMDSKSILLAPVEFPTDYKVLNWPSASGLVTIVKMSNDTVRAEYTDRETSNTWTGIYNAVTHEFIRWQFSEDASANYLLAQGNEFKLRADSPVPVHDFEVWSIKLPTNVQPTATLQINDSEYMMLKTVTGEPIKEILSINSVIMITFDGYRKCWVLLSETRSIASQLMQIMAIRLDSQTGDLTALIGEVRTFIEETKDVIGAIHNRLDRLEKSPGKIVYDSRIFTITETNRNEIILDKSFAAVGVDIILANLGQTILQIGVDYTTNANTNALTFSAGRTLSVGDTIQIIVIKQ